MFGAAATWVAAKVLVFNDDNAFLDLMRELLTDEGFEAAIHKTWEDARGIVIREKPDLVILDLYFNGEKHGYHLIDMLTLDPATRAIPIVVCSAATQALKEHENAFAALGIVTIQKPFDLEQLLQAIRAKLDPPGRAAISKPRTDR